MAQAPHKFTTGKLYHLEMSRLSPDPEQPRKFMDKSALAELTTSVEKHGVLQPVLVRCGEDGNFLLVSGERRYQASLEAGLATIPAILTKGDPAEISIVENLLREDLTAIEEAEAVDRLRNSHNYQLCDLAGVLGKAESTICEILSLTKLPDAVKDDCRNDPKAARSILAEIAKLRTADKMCALYQKYKASGLARGEIRRKKSTIKGEAVQAAEETSNAAPIDLDFVQKFTRRLEALDIESLGQPQSAEFMTRLNALRLTVRRKLYGLKALASI